MRKKEDNAEVGAVVYERSQHCVSRSNIDPDALKILRRLLRHGYKAYLVGGGVRDLLLEKIPKDFDIATNASPRRIKALFRNCRIIGRRFKLAHIYFGNGKIIEVSTFRANESTEKESTGPQAELLIRQDNIYGTEKTDAQRRDVTINALFYDLASFSIIDYVGGMPDLKAGIVRVIGDPHIRFAEDPIRMLRVVRHAVRAGFTIESTCAAAIQENHALIEKSSQVRLYEELKKDLCCGYLRPILQQYAEHHLLEHFLPELGLESTSLTQSEAYFNQALQQLDALAGAGQLKSPTIVLALLTLFSSTGSVLQPDLASRFDNARMLGHFLRLCYSSLPVPRKERERIELLLNLWLKAVRQPVERLARDRQFTPANRRELAQLLSCLNFPGQPPEQSQGQFDLVLSWLSGGGAAPGEGKPPLRKKDHRRSRKVGPLLQRG